MGCVRRFNCVTHARTLLPFFRLPGLLFFPVSSPSLSFRTRSYLVWAPTRRRKANENKEQQQQNKNKESTRGRHKQREREGDGQRQTGKFACLECLDMLKSSLEFLVVPPSFFHSPLACAQHENEICIWQWRRYLPETREYCLRQFIRREIRVYII